MLTKVVVDNIYIGCWVQYLTSFETEQYGEIIVKITKTMAD